MDHPIIRITQTIVEVSPELPIMHCYAYGLPPCHWNMIESRFKSNNFIAILIALILVATGFALAFIHRQSKSESSHDKKPVAALSAAAADTKPYVPGKPSE